MVHLGRENTEEDEQGERKTGRPPRSYASCERKLAETKGKAPQKGETVGKVDQTKNKQKVNYAFLCIRHERKGFRGMLFNAFLCISVFFLASFAHTKNLNYVDTKAT